MKKKVLILGGAGFIGLGIAKYLGENRNYEITIADIFSPGQTDSDFQQIVSDYSIKLFDGDFADPEMFKKLDSNYDRPKARKRGPLTISGRSMRSCEFYFPRFPPPQGVGGRKR